MLSVDSGSFAPMTFNYHQASQPTTIGMVGNSYASRGKAQNIRRISVSAPQNLSPPTADADLASVQTPRTGRAQLLAGLRTAPKTPTTATMPPQDMYSNGNGMDASRYASQRASANALPIKSARGLQFPGVRGNNQTQQPNYPPRSSPPQYQQTLASQPQQPYNSNLPTPPSTSPQIGNSASDLDYEAKVYAELLAQNIYLAQQQQILQQQLRTVQQAQQFQQVQQQFQQLNIQSPMSGNFSTPPVSPAVYNMPNVQNFQNAGYCSVYNPLTGQYNYYLAQAQAPAQTHVQTQSPVQPEPEVQSYYTPPARRSPSPPKVVEQEQTSEKSTTPQPFRRSHRKCSSLSISNAINEEGPKVPFTPMNGCFNGQVHPSRQPKNPPEISEIIAAPTTKHKGAKNFASRTRRLALQRLVGASADRQSTSSSSSNPGSMSPVSEDVTSALFETANTVSDNSGRLSSQSNERPTIKTPRLVLTVSDKRKSAIF